MYVSFFYVRAESCTLHAHDPQLSFADEIIESPRGRKHILVKIEQQIRSVEEAWPPSPLDS